MLPFVNLIVRRPGAILYYKRQTTGLSRRILKFHLETRRKRWYLQMNSHAGSWSEVQRTTTRRDKSHKLYGNFRRFYNELNIAFMDAVGTIVSFSS